MAKKLLTTPKGTFVWPHLTVPDTKYKDEGEYHVKHRLAMADKNTAKLIKSIDAAMAASLATARAEAASPAKAKRVKPCDNPPYVLEEDEDGEPTGYVLVNFKMTASGVSRKTNKPYTRKPALYDAVGRPLPADAKIGSGTIGKVSYEMSEFYTAQLGAGVKLRLEAVQIIKLVEWGEREASAYGFGDETEDEDYEETQTVPVDDEDEDEEEEEEEAPAPPPTRKKSGGKKAAPPPVEEDEDEDDEDEDDF